MKPKYIIGIVISIVMMVVLAVNVAMSAMERKEIEQKNMEVTAYISDSRREKIGSRRQYISYYEAHYRYRVGGTELSYYDPDYLYFFSPNEYHMETFYVNPETYEVVLANDSKDTEKSSIFMAVGFLVNAIFQLVIGLIVGSRDISEIESISFIGTGICAILVTIGICYRANFLVPFADLMCLVVLAIFVILFKIARGDKSKYRC
ncbi:MAG: hypothetical protein MJ166_07960 [Clostridia bacterium]|nr:hypothetical protein [Clostridia bacterium]